MLRRRCWALVLTVAACGSVPGEGATVGSTSTTGEPDGGTTSGPTPTTSGVADESGEAGDPLDVGMQTGADTGSTTGDDESTGSSGDGPEVPPQCKDGVSVPGELCLEPEYDYPVVQNPISVAVGDVNDDGRLDVVTGSDSVATVSVLLGQPDGSFGVPGVFVSDTAGASDFVFLAHLDDDMLPDLLVVDGSNRRLLAHLNASGSLTDPVITTFTPTPTRATVGDTNGDGRPDLMMVTNASTLVRFRNTNNGTFVEEEPIPVGTGAIDVALGDLDGNGWLDVLTANDSARTVSLLYNQAGVLVAAEDTITGDTNTRAVATGDFNEDGNLDVIHCNWGDDTLFLSIALATGGFAQTPITIAVTDRPQRVLVEDFDLDGHLDFAVAQQGGADQVSVHLGSGAGVFGEPISLDLSHEPSDLATGDFNDDGVPDLVVVLEAPDRAIVFLSDP